MKVQFNLQNSKWKIFFLFLISVTLQLKAQSNKYKFDFYGYEQGLNGNINCMLLDSYGFIWIGSTLGLVKYNGYEFESFLNNPEDSTSISNNYINCFVEDNKHNLWIGTQNGLNKFNIFSKLSARYFYNPNAESGLSDSYITALYIDDENILWIGTQKGGLNKTDLKQDNSQNLLQNKFSHYIYNSEDTTSISNNHIKSILEFPGNNNYSLWIAAIDGLNILDKKSNKFKQFFHDEGNKNSLPSNGLASLFVDRDRKIWLGTNDGYISLVKDPNNISFENYYTGRDGLILDINEDSHGNLWIGDRLHGLLRFNKTTKIFNKLPSNLGKKDYPDEIRTIFFDTQKRMWTASRWGLHKFDPNIQQFNYHPLKPPKNLWVLWPTSFCKRNNEELWVGTKGNGIVYYKTFPEVPVHYLPKKNDPGSLCSRWITQIVCTKKGRIWIGTNQGLDRYEPNTDSFIHYKEKYLNNNPNFLTNEFINTLYLDSKDNLWIGSAGGISKYNKINNTFTHYLNDEKQLREIGFYVGAIYEDSSGKMWVGANGLYQFDPSKNKIKKYLADKNNPASGIEHMVFSIIEDNNFNLWVSTYEGLFCLNKNNTLKQFTEKDGLPSNITYGLLKDDDGFIWAGTFKGLVKLEPQNNSLRCFELSGNFLQDEFAVRGSFKDDGGNFYLGQANRITYFHPREIKNNSILVPVVLTSIKVSDKEMEFNKPISDVDVINLSHKENRLNISWVGLTYTNNDKIKYAYKLEGLNENWMNCEKEREVTFINLDPDEYVFRVKACNDDGVWDEEGVSLNIIITPPWWETTWAYAFYIFSGLSVFAGSLLFERNRQKQKAKRKLLREKELRELQESEHRAEVAELQARTSDAEKRIEKEQMRSRIASDLHDEVGSNLSSIELISNLLEKKPKSEKEQKRHLHNIADIAHSTGDSMRDIVWFVNPQNDDMQMLLSKMRETSNLMLEHLDYSFNVNGNNFTFQSSLNFRRNIYMIYKEILQNIVKHSKAEKVDIDISRTDGVFRLQIEENGIGFETEKKYSGNGLKNLRMRTKEINGNIKIESEINKGTIIELTVEIP